MTDHPISVDVERIRELLEKATEALSRLDARDPALRPDRYRWDKAARACIAFSREAPALLASAERLQEVEKENETLRLTMLGGEDAPGYAASLPLADVLRSFKELDNERRSRVETAEASRKWRAEVVAFADLMEGQLSANDHKPGWQRENPWPLLSRLREETDELAAELQPGSRTSAEAWRRRVGAEAADVANFALMIADVCGALALTKPTQGEATAHQEVWSGVYARQALAAVDAAQKGEGK